MKIIKMTITSSAVSLLLLVANTLPMSPVYAETQTYRAVHVAPLGFGDASNTEVHMFVLNEEQSTISRQTRGFGRLFALTSNEYGVQLWRAVNTMANDWEQIPNAPFAQDSTNVDVVTLHGFNHHVYAVMNSTDGVEVWRWSRMNGWERVFSRTGSSVHGSFLTPLPDHRLYFGFVNEDGQAEIVRTRNGRGWQNFSSEGLGNNITEAIDMRMFHDAIIVTTNSGEILRKVRGEEWNVVATHQDSLSTMEIYGSGDNAFAIVGGSGLNGATVRMSRDGITWENLVNDGFGNPHNTTITRLSGPRAPHGMIRAYTKNTIDGFEIWETDPSNPVAWTKVGSSIDLDGLYDEVTSAVRYGKRVFESATSTEGALIYRLTPKK